MTEQEIFEGVCSANGLGLRLDIENYPDVPAAPAYAHTRKIAQELIESARAMFPLLLPIHFDFVNSGEINAWATRVEDKYFIGLTAGAMSMLHLILDRMLAHPLLFPTIGEPDAEDPNLPSVPWHIPNAERLFNAGVRPILPKSRARCLYANHLADQAILFLVGHEVPHITRGHVDYLQYTTGSAFIAELGWSGTPEGRLERQALEVDADERSLRARCYSALGTARIAGEKFPPWSIASRHPGEWQFDWGFAVNTLFRLFGDPMFSGVQPYPPLPLRRRLAMDSAIHLLTQAWGDKQIKLAREVILWAVLRTEAAFEAVGADSSDGGLNDTNTPQSIDHTKRIAAAWQAVESKLKPQSYERLEV